MLCIINILFLVQEKADYASEFHDEIHRKAQEVDFLNGENRELRFKLN